MPDREIVLVEWFDEHWYRVTVGDVVRYLPSVTTKLGIVDKPNLARWRGDIGNREADLRMYDAGQRGKRIHWAWETALRGGAVIYDPWQNPVYDEQGILDLKAKHQGLVSILRTQDEMWAVAKLQRQFDILKPRVIATEEKVYDLDTNDAGTIDHVYWIDPGEYAVNGSKPLVLAGGIYIGDLKTGNDIHDQAWYQTAKYLDMWEKRAGMQCAGTMVTHTSARNKRGIPGLATVVHTREEVMDRDLPMYQKIAAVWDAVHKDDQPEAFQFPAFIQLDLGGNNETAEAK